MKKLFLCLFCLALPVAGNAQNLTFTSSETRHRDVSAVALDCNADYPVTAARAGSELALTVWDKDRVVNRLGSAGFTTDGPIAVATGQGVAGGPNFKIVTASLMPQTAPTNMRGRIQITTWGVAGGQINRMRTRILTNLPANPEKLALTWTSAGLILGSFSGGSRLNLARFDVNFVTGQTNPPAVSVITNIDDFALDGDRNLPKAVLAIRVSDRIRMQDIDALTGARVELFRTPVSFALPGNPDLDEFDVQRIKAAGNDTATTRLVALDNTGVATVFSSATNSQQLSNIPLDSVSAMVGSSVTVNAIGTRSDDGRYINLATNDHCTDRNGQAARAPVGCFIDGNTAQNNAFDDLAFTAKISGSNRLRVSSWSIQNCSAGGFTIAGPIASAPATPPAGVFAAAGTHVDPANNLTCVGVPSAGQAVVSFRWLPAGVAAGTIASVNQQIEIQEVGVACPAVPDPRSTTGSLANITQNGSCIFTETNVNEHAEVLRPNTTYRWRVRSFDRPSASLGPFSAFTTFTTGGPPEEANFIAPSPAPQNNFPTQGKALDLIFDRARAAFVSARWAAPSCRPSTFDGTIVATKRILTGFDQDGDNIPDTKLVAIGGTFAGTCHATTPFCQADNIRVEQPDDPLDPAIPVEYLLQLEQTNTFGSSLSHMTFSVKP